MKIVGKSIAAAVLAISATGASEAAIQSIGANTLDGSEFLFNVWNSTDQSSYTLDLGKTVAQFLANPAGPLNFNSILSADANFTSFLSTYQATDAVTYGVFGGSVNLGSSGLDLTTYGFINTSVSNGAGALQPTYGDLGSFQHSAFDNLLGQLGMPGTVADNFSVYRTVGQVGYTGDYANNFQGTTPTTSQGAVGSDLFFLFDRVIDNGNYDQGERVVFANKWNFSVNAGVGSLTFAPAVSNVPLPAAVWMFGAGLMGVLRANRRKSLAA